MLLDKALTKVVEYLETDISEGILGTSNTIASPTDTSLSSPDNSTDTSTVDTISINQLTITFDKGSTVGIGTTYKEIGIKNSTDEYYTRFVIPSIVGSSTEEWTFKTRINVQRL